ncbi:hypothetical protein E4T43_07009 [Aureobasidium subglaciale]|nr:hypothetical protein E4T43_07009 [Aureobasidium subglaciale]
MFHTPSALSITTSLGCKSVSEVSSIHANHLGVRCENSRASNTRAEACHDEGFARKVRRSRNTPLRREEDHEVASSRKRTAESMFSLRMSSAGCLRSSAGGVVERLRPTWDAQVGPLKGAPPARRVPSGHLACTMHTVPGPTQSFEDLEM